MTFALNGLTVTTVPNFIHDIWEHRVKLPTEVRQNGVLLTNWEPVYVHGEDAVGNWELVQGHRSLDPRYIWKLDMDFEPTSAYSPGDLTTADLSLTAGKKVITNNLGVPITFSWSEHKQWQDVVDVDMPTNRPDLALRVVSVKDSAGKKVNVEASSWNQYSFRKVIRNMQHSEMEVVVAVVPNVRATFYAQPKLFAAAHE